MADEDVVHAVVRISSQIFSDPPVLKTVEHYLNQFSMNETVNLDACAEIAQNLETCLDEGQNAAFQI